MTGERTQPNLQVEMESGLLEEIIRPAVELAPRKEAKLRWYEDYLEVKIVDAPQTISVEQKVIAHQFEQYDVVPEKEVILFGAKCGMIANLLEATESDDLVELNLNFDTNKMNICFDGVDFSLSGVSVEEITEPPTNELNLDNEVKAKTTIFTKANHLVGMVSNRAELNVGDGTFVVTGRSDTDKIDVEFEVVDSTDKLETEEGEVLFEEDNGMKKTRIKVDNLAKIAKLMGENIVFLGIKDEYPIKISAKRYEDQIPTTIRVAPYLVSES